MTIGSVRVVAMAGTSRSRIPTRRAFTLVELLVVLGLVALLLTLLLPVVGKVQAAANSAACLSNLRQMGIAWVSYTTESRGHLPHSAWVSSHPGRGWDQYWPGVLEARQVRGVTLRCPSASEPSQNQKTRGYGNVALAWTGKFSAIGTVFKLNDTTYRDSSYGYNDFLTAGSGFAGTSTARRITAARGLSDVPVFLDCAAVGVWPHNGTGNTPVEPPPDLRGDTIALDTPEHWNFLLARHGRGVNAFMADGSARWVRLEDTYSLNWRNDWIKYRLPLPAR